MSDNEESMKDDPELVEQDEFGDIVINDSNLDTSSNEIKTERIVKKRNDLTIKEIKLVLEKLEVEFDKSGSKRKAYFVDLLNKNCKKSEFNFILITKKCKINLLFIYRKIFGFKIYITLYSFTSYIWKQK